MEKIVLNKNKQIKENLKITRCPLELIMLLNNYFKYPVLARISAKLTKLVSAKLRRIFSKTNRAKLN